MQGIFQKCGLGTEEPPCGGKGSVRGLGTKSPEAEA